MTETIYKIIFLFSGQGAQYHGMAESLYRLEPVFRKWMDEFDKVCVLKTRPVTRFLYADSEAVDSSIIIHVETAMGGADHQ